MKKLFVIVLTLAFVMAGGMCFAADGPANPNAQWAGGSGESIPFQGPAEFIRVRYGHCDANSGTILSGTVVSWDINSADGYTISVCTGQTTAGGVPAFAGVLLSSIQTDDVSGYQKGERSVGYMAIRGYCLALTDTSAAEAGFKIVPTSDVTLPGYLGTVGSAGGIAGNISGDSGTLLQDTGSDGLMPVVLK